MAAGELKVLDGDGNAKYLKTESGTGISGDPWVPGQTVTANAGTNLNTSALSTSAKQDTQITAEQAILAKILAAPATEAKQDTMITAEQAILATAGATSGAAVVTDANGTLQQYLRGLVKLLITSGTIILGAGTAAIGKLAANSGVTIGAVEIAAAQTLATITTVTTVTTVSAVTAITNALPAGTNAIGKLAANAGINIGVVGGTTIEVSDEFTRVADTNVYAVGDAIGATVSNTGTTALRGITVGAAVGATGYLTKIRLWTDQAACVAQIRVHFFTVAAPTTALPGDNVANIAYYANRAQSIGYVDLPALGSETGANTGARATDMTTRLPFQCDAADTKLYYRLQTNTIFTPASAQAFYLAISGERNAA